MKVYTKYCRPGLVKFLEAIGLDVVYERVEGDRLWQKRGEKLFEVLDFAGSCGASLFGHKPESICINSINAF